MNASPSASPSPAASPSVSVSPSPSSSASISASASLPTPESGPACTGPVGFEDMAVGLALPARTIVITRADLVRYAGASGDFNPIHYNERVAREAGLPGVIAHGMFTMGAVIDVVSAWVGDPGLVTGYDVRFSRPVPVPDPGEARVAVTGQVTAIDPAQRSARVMLTVAYEGAKVLGKAVVGLTWR